MHVILKKVELLIFDSPAWKLILVIFAIMLFKTGIWYIPNLQDSLLIAQNPFVFPTGRLYQPYLFWNWLGPFLAWSLKIKTWWSFFMMHFLFSIGFTCLFINIIFDRFSDKTARYSLVLFCLLPVSITSYYWVSYDSITLFFMMLAFAYPQYIFVTLLAGICIGMQHFEQGFFASAALLCAVFFNIKYDTKINYSFKFCSLFFLSILLGKLILVCIFKYYSIEVPSRMFFVKQDHGYLLTPFKEFIFHIHSCIWGILGLGWLIALRYLDLKRKAIPFLRSFIALCILLPFSGDETRVLAVATFPILAVYWLLNENFLDKISKKEISFVFLLWAIIPLDWVAGGLPKWSVFPYDIAQLLHALFGWFNVSNNPWWPMFSAY